MRKRCNDIIGSPPGLEFFAKKYALGYFSVKIVIGSCKVTWHDMTTGVENRYFEQTFVSVNSSLDGHFGLKNAIMTLLRSDVTLWKP